MDVSVIKKNASFSGFTLHCRHVPELVLGVLETLRDEIDRLVFLVLVRLHRGDGRLERPQLRFAGHRVQQLAVRGQQPRAVRLHLAVLLAKAELDREPVDLRAHKTFSQSAVRHAK